MDKQTNDVLAGLGFIAFLIVGGFGYLFFKMEQSKQQKIEETSRLVVEEANRLDDIEIDGDYDREQDSDEIDAWGTPLRVEYYPPVAEMEEMEFVKVTSAGPDRKFETEDDIEKEKSNGKAIAAGKKAGEWAVEASVGAARGIKDGIMNTLKKPEEEESEPEPVEE